MSYSCTVDYTVHASGPVAARSTFGVSVVRCSLVNTQKCVTDYFDGAMCAADVPRGPGLVARMDRRRMQPDAAESGPRRLPHALKSRIWTLPRAPPAGMVRTASCRATPRWIHGVPLHTRSAAKLVR